MEEEKSTFIFGCPICGHQVEAPVELVGVQAECPDCESQITVPKPAWMVEKEKENFPPTILMEESFDDQKSKTIKIELPEEVELRMPTKRRIVIKRR